MNRAQRRAAQKSNKKGEKSNNEVDNVMGHKDEQHKSQIKREKNQTTK